MPTSDSLRPGWTVGPGAPYAANSDNYPQSLTPPAALYIIRLNAPLPMLLVNRL